MVRLLEDLSLTNLKPVTFHCDNMSALHIAKNPIYHERTKHIEVDCHFAWEKVMTGLLQLTYFPTSKLADLFTKILSSAQFYHFYVNQTRYAYPSQVRGGMINIWYMAEY